MSSSVNKPWMDGMHPERKRTKIPVTINACFGFIITFFKVYAAKELQAA
jgi:hypothetical protein